MLECDKTLSLLIILVRLMNNKPYLCLDVNQGLLWGFIPHKAKQMGVLPCYSCSQSGLDEGEISRLLKCKGSIECQSVPLPLLFDRKMPSL